jgi:hypothetical protein
MIIQCHGGESRLQSETNSTGNITHKPCSTLTPPSPSPAAYLREGICLSSDKTEQISLVTKKKKQNDDHKMTTFTARKTSLSTQGLISVSSVRAISAPHHHKVRHVHFACIAVTENVKDRLAARSTRSHCLRTLKLVEAEVVA